MKILTFTLLAFYIQSTLAEPLGLLDHSWSFDGQTDGYDIRGGSQVGHDHFGGDVWIDSQSRTYVSGSYQSEQVGGNNGLKFARLTRYTATGQLDTSFNGTGVLDFPLPLASLSDNDVFVTGSEQNGVFIGYSRIFCPTQDDADCHMDIRVHHVSSSGSNLDHITVAFDVGSTFQRNDDRLVDMAYSNELDRLFLAAEIEFTNANDTDFGAVAIEVSANGTMSLDNNFSFDGKQTCYFDHANAAGSQDQASAIAINPLGTVVIGGHAFEGNGINADGWNQAFCEFSLSGDLIRKWSTQSTGIQLDSREFLNDLLFLKTGLNESKLYALGTQPNAGTLDASVSVYELSQLNEWQLDSTYGENNTGITLLGLDYAIVGDTEDYASEFSMLPSGHMLVTGTLANPNQNQSFFSGLFLGMLKPDGKIDKSWGYDGFTKHNFSLTSPIWDNSNALAIDPNTQDIIVTGFHYNGAFNQLTAKFHNDRIFSSDFD